LAPQTQPNHDAVDAIVPARIPARVPAGAHTRRILFLKIGLDEQSRCPVHRIIDLGQRIHAVIVAIDAVKIITMIRNAGTDNDIFAKLEIESKTDGIRCMARCTDIVGVAKTGGNFREEAETAQLQSRHVILKLRTLSNEDIAVATKDIFSRILRLCSAGRPAIDQSAQRHEPPACKAW
jgi:hypothetical protein